MTDPTRPVRDRLVEALHRAIVHEHYGDHEPHPSYLAPDSDQRLKAERMVEDVWPVIADALAAAAERDALRAAVANFLAALDDYGWTAPTGATLTSLRRVLAGEPQTDKETNR